MKVLFVSAEVSPFAKVGGLADVAGSLPQALHELGLDVRVVMPSYAMVERDPKWRLRRVAEDCDVAINPHWVKRAYLNESEHRGVPVYMVGTDEWFTESTASASVYRPGADPYLFLSAAATELCAHVDWKPDVVHANDWHTGFLPVLMRERRRGEWDDTASVFTIHNLAYQGEFGFDILDKLGLPHYLFNMEQLEFYGCVNFLKAGCVFADQVNTVSPTYGKEIQTPEYGCRLDGLMMHLARQGRLSGILNGIDDEEFNPATDPHLAARYTADDLSGKEICRTALLQELGMEPIEGALLIGMVSRLSGQKGMDLVLEAAEGMLQMPCQLVVQGLGDPWLTDRFRQYEQANPGRVRFINAFDVPLAQRVYAGCDAFLMPSAYEPCGLGQMIAMRYGTVPIVRRTGGLADTVFEPRNGFVFDERTPEALLAAVRRAHTAYGVREVWEGLVDAAMRGDFSWARSAREYVAMYERALAQRRPAVRARSA